MLLQKFRPVEKYDNAAIYVLDRMTDNMQHLKSANGKFKCQQPIIQ